MPRRFSALALAAAFALPLAACAETGESQRVAQPDAGASEKTSIPAGGGAASGDPMPSAAGSPEGRDAISGRILSVDLTGTGSITLEQPVQGISVIVMKPETVVRDGRGNPVARETLAKSTLIQASGRREDAQLTADEVIVQQMP